MSVRERAAGRGRAGPVAVAALALLATSVGLLAPSAAASSGSSAPGPVPSFVPSAAAWTPCGSGFQCADLRVPLDYDRPHGATISLSVIRLRSASPGKRLGSLLMNPGGPGGSGVDLVRGIGQRLPLRLRSRFDIVGFDPRGIMRSTPLRCFDTLKEADSVLPPFPFPQSGSEERDFRTYVDDLAEACAEHGGPIRDHMSTADVARDMDSLRSALGDRKLTYVGFSYGSALGQNFANLFPTRVRALVIDGVLDPRAWTGTDGAGRTLPVGFRLRSAAGAQKTLMEFFRLCDEARRDCAFSGRASSRYAALVERLRDHPVKVQMPDGSVTLMSDKELVALTLGGLYRSAAWPDLAAVLAEVEKAASPAALGRRLTALRIVLGLPRLAQQAYPNTVEGYPGVACSDSINPKDFSAWRRAADRAEREDGYFGRPWAWAGAECQPWPKTAGQDRYLGPWGARTLQPVLVVGNRFDPATRYEGAVAASHLLPNSRLLTYAGWGHTAYLGAGNSCVDDAVTRYLITSRPPARGTVCQPEGSPFGPPATTTARTAAATSAAAFGALPAQARRALGAP